MRRPSEAVSLVVVMLRPPSAQMVTVVAQCQLWPSIIRYRRDIDANININTDNRPLSRSKSNPVTSSLLILVGQGPCLVTRPAGLHKCTNASYTPPLQTIWQVLEAMDSLRTYTLNIPSGDWQPHASDSIASCVQGVSFALHPGAYVAPTPCANARHRQGSDASPLSGSH